MNRLIGIFSFFGLIMVAPAQADLEQKCSMEAASHLGTYIQNASAAQAGWKILRGYSTTHTPVLGRFSKLMKEAEFFREGHGIFDIPERIKKFIKEKKDGKVSSGVKNDLQNTIRTVMNNSFDERYGDVVEGWELFKARAYTNRLSAYATQTSFGTKLKNLHNVNVSDDEISVSVCTEIIQNEESVKKFGFLAIPKTGENSFAHYMCTTWNLIDDTIETTMGPSWARSNPYDGRFMSFKDYLIASSLVSDECIGFLKTGKTPIYLGKRSKALYNVRNNIRKSSSVIFLDDKGKEVKVGRAAR